MMCIFSCYVLFYIMYCWKMHDWTIIKEPCGCRGRCCSVKVAQRCFKCYSNILNAITFTLSIITHPVCASLYKTCKYSVVYIFSLNCAVNICMMTFSSSSTDHNHHLPRGWCTNWPAECVVLTLSPHQREESLASDPTCSFCPAL